MSWRLDGKPRFVAQMQRRCTDAFLECISWFVSGNTLVFADHSDCAMPHLVLRDLGNGAQHRIANAGTKLFRPGGGRSHQRQAAP